jgi:hypothetical protein
MPASFPATTVNHDSADSGIPLSDSAYSGPALIADFTGARFYLPPVFDGAASASRIDFTGVHVSFAPPGKLLHWTGNSRIPLFLRAFRKIAEETKNHDLERDLYIRGTQSRTWRLSGSTPIPSEGFQFLVIFQNLFSITCVFFIGLALRNYFRIK